jgi:hypothetical protein
VIRTSTEGANVFIEENQHFLLASTNRPAVKLNGTFPTISNMLKDWYLYDKVSVPVLLSNGNRRASVIHTKKKNLVTRRKLV